MESPFWFEVLFLVGWGLQIVVFLETTSVANLMQGTKKKKDLHYFSFTNFLYLDFRDHSEYVKSLSE